MAQPFDQLLYDWVNAHGYKLSTHSLQGRVVQRIDIITGRQDDVIDRWLDTDGSIAIDFVSGRTSICGSRNCPMGELIPMLDSINRELKDVDSWADYPHP